MTCGEYLEDMRAGRYDQIYTQWLSGFLSGYNIYSRHPQVKVPEEATLRAYLDKYCRENPLRHVVGAATPLITDLGGFKP